MITLNQKKEIVADLVERFNRASGFYLVDFMGMNVEDSSNFRKELKEKGIEFKIAKNTLVKRALIEAGSEGLIPDDKFFASTGIVFAIEDPVAPAKIIKSVFDKKDLPKLKAAVIENVYYDGSQLTTLAALQSKPEVISGIIGSLQSPISGIVGSINAVMRDLAYLVEEVAKKAS